ncbi:MAG: FG-GAP-like repeat-containing protein, partial [Gammaproteobacteria bacterium]|nr:FG-GAP-like repeat-containing protein [Gammaproteobacteria bacterium]
RWYENLYTATAPTQAPANVRIVPGVGTLWVTWDAVPGLGESEQAMARYEVAALGADGTVAARCIAESLIGCSLTGLDSTERYRVTVHAENVAGEGPESEPVTAVSLEDVGPPGTRFAPRRVVATGVADTNSVHAGDLDGDGDMDVLATATDDDAIFWWENSGSGHFAVRHLVVSDVSGPVVALADDLDQDGDGDVVSASFYDRLVYKHQNLGDAGFSAAEVIATDITNSYSLSLVDIDADGWTDVLLGGVANGALAWHRNQGDGQFTRARVIDQPDRQVLAEITATDFDGDGDRDVLAAPGSGSAIRWHENLGQGTFSQPRLIVEGLEYEDTSYLGAADLDGDGDSDIVHHSYLDSTLAWFENLSGSVLGRRVIALGGESGIAVNVADLDGDGDQDLVVGDYEEDKIVWYENLDRGQFSDERIIASSLDGFNDLHTADLDGDGDLDVLCATYGDDTIAWYENID